MKWQRATPPHLNPLPRRTGERRHEKAIASPLQSPLPCCVRERVRVRVLPFVAVVLAVVGVTNAAPLSDSEFNSLLKQLHVKSQPWATIPWKVSVSEARALAAKTGKPIFMVVNTGNCLGFV